jgi:uncharacterized protein YsxB (DUF464 family)
VIKKHHPFGGGAFPLGGMQLIVITHEEGRITIEGHAGYAPHGQDIVCAAVSTLVQAFYLSVKELTQDEITADMAAGKAVIEYGKLSGNAQTLLASFFIGCEMIAIEYPKNVRIAQAWMA